MNQYQVHCECGCIKITLEGEPKVRGFCHCEDCRTLLNIPFHAVTAWNKDQVEVIDNESMLREYQHTKLRMKRLYCSSCGETVMNTNAMDWRIVSLYLISKCYSNSIPEKLQPKAHFFYGRRVIDVDDSLPKRD